MSSGIDIQLFNESDIAIPLSRQDLEEASLLVSQKEKCGFSLLEVVYVDQREIARINKEYLDRSYITDIITFRYDEEESNLNIEGTLFCCAPRIFGQSIEYNQSERKEFMRVYIHGLLHLAGYKDGTKTQKKQMKKREDFYLDQLNL